MNISEIDELLGQLAIEFPQKSVARILEEEKYNQIYILRDQVINPIKKVISIWHD